MRSLVGAALLVGSLLVSNAQDVVANDVLTLNEALELTRERNGTVRAALQNIRASDARVSQALADFYPTLTPQYQYSDIKRERDQQTFAQSGAVSLFRLQWQILDSGQRDLTARASRRNRDASILTAQQTLRETLFTTTQRYYETLRAQELKRVADSQVTRAETILEQTRARIEVRDAAPIEELQANADFQNARVTALTARNRVTNNAALLRAVIGLQPSEPLPMLLRETEAPKVELPTNLETVLAEGLERRPDLASRRRSIEASNLNRLRAARDAGVGLAFNFFDDYQVTPDRLNDQTFQLTLTYPLFDGGQRRAAVRELDASLQASRLDLLQLERNARADIEAAYAELTTNTERLESAQIALDAARRNYEAAVESRTAGAGDLLQVLTAQVSLVTAESNFIEALYDTRISDVRLRLVTGQPIPGEDTL
jgi:outer membrane protein